MIRLLLGLFCLFTGMCCAALQPKPLSQLRQDALPWDVFWFDADARKVRITVIRADEWRFEEGCFIAEKPMPYVQCEVIRVRPCTEQCQ